MLPIFLAVAALGLDFFVQTDLEKINTIIRTAIKAAEDENPNAISKILSDNYHDSYHNTKADLMHYCRTLLERPLVEKNRKMDSVIELSPPKATVTLIVLTKFDKESYVYKNSKRFLLTKVKLDLQKERNKRWLINRAELLELDRQPVKWQHIR